MRTIVLDIETLPDHSVWTPPQVKEGEPDPFPPPHAHRVLCGGMMVFEKSGAIHWLVTTSQVESVAIEAIWETIGQEQCEVVTWNGRAFDLPVLSLRALRYAIPTCFRQGLSLLSFPQVTPWVHTDLLHEMTEGGVASRIKLDGAAKLIGLPGKYGDIDGAGVAAAYAAGQMDSIRDYCLADAFQTAFLWMRWRGFGQDQIRALLTLCEVRLPGLHRRIDQDVLVR